MDQQENARQVAALDTARTPEPGAWVDARLPLFLLEALQSTDLPSEVLEDEDVTVSMPRRFGLNNMVHTQIHRFRSAASKRGRVPAADLRHWIELVSRRPDAEELLARAGARFASVHWHGRPWFTRALIRFAPGVIGRRMLAREARRLVRPIAGSRSQDSEPTPVTIRIEEPVTVAADPGGMACALFTGALQELAALASVTEAEVRHTRCSAADGVRACEWVVLSKKKD